MQEPVEEGEGKNLVMQNVLPLLVTFAAGEDDALLGGVPLVEGFNHECGFLAFACWTQATSITVAFTG